VIVAGQRDPYAITCPNTKRLKAGWSREMGKHLPPIGQLDLKQIVGQ
jgi:hypothetical protein